MNYRKPQVQDYYGHRLVALFFLGFALYIFGRLFFLQILRHDHYLAVAARSHETSEQVEAERGSIYFADSRTGESFPAAINKTYYLVYAVPKSIPASAVVSTTNKLATILKFDEVKKSDLLEKLSEHASVYKVIEKKVSEEVANEIKKNNINGIRFEEQKYRFYPEDSIGASVLGFAQRNNAGELDGKYGIEGYFNKKLSGRAGYILGEKGAQGDWITLAERTNIQAENGCDIYLTIDRALQKYACDRLRQGLKDYKAKSASLVLMNPKTGAILAMCSLPDFDPNNYSQVDDLSVFNNTSVFVPYEPGSVFKTFTMGAGLDLGIVSPFTTYVDPCEMNINGYKVRNAEQKCYGRQTMTQVLEKSINTGVVWVEERLGGDRFRNYVKKFGFGEKTGISLSQEMSGDISSLDKRGEIFGANGSFGQGLTATPLQLATAYSAVANNGKLMKPYIVSEERYDDGHSEKSTPEVIDLAISEGAARLLSGMLISVVDNHYFSAKIENYYVAGKTGTAQIPEKGKYSLERTNHTFAGFAPATRPVFTLIVKYEEPELKWAEQTALPVFHDVMQFALNYYGIPGDKK
ncbi:MAG: penicillin-binding protein 2 [Patescibacteria group bacterium]|jgi:cell division protein FtsI/penicillin-binding protein 2